MRIVLSTIDDVQKAQELATTLVDRKLAACVNIIPSVWSVYHWQGTVEKAVENLLIFKTSNDRLEELMEGLRELHPYDLPEIIALPLPQQEGGGGFGIWNLKFNMRRSGIRRLQNAGCGRLIEDGLLPGRSDRSPERNLRE